MRQQQERAQGVAARLMVGLLYLPQPASTLRTATSYQVLTRLQRQRRSLATCPRRGQARARASSSGRHQALAALLVPFRSSSSKVNGRRVGRRVRELWQREASAQARVCQCWLTCGSTCR